MKEDIEAIAEKPDNKEKISKAEILWRVLVVFCTVYTILNVFLTPPKFIKDMPLVGYRCVLSACLLLGIFNIVAALIKWNTYLNQAK